MKVYCYPADRNSAYLPLLFAGIEDAYERVHCRDGSLRDAIDDLEAARPVIVHIHWEEFVLRSCCSEGDADAASAAFIAELARIRKGGGAIVWTVHNELPHEIVYHRQFLAMRRALGCHADAILLHTEASRATLAAQVTIADTARVRVLPHPSYIGQFEDEVTLRAEFGEPPDRCIAGFGWIRFQKGFGQMIGMLPADFLQARDAYVRISGSGAQATAVIAQQADRTDVQWDVRHVPDAEIPRLLRSAACVVLPYERVLTSGVALLAMSVGALIVAIDRPHMRELLPPANHRYLYAQGDGRALREVIDMVLRLSSHERRTVLEANLAVARDLHPGTIAQRLAAVYREVATTDSH